ncbi:MAG: BspA family leucine-rich repeat surface protein [Spirochaetaceae bacterium]|nr:BspA family leucine-rich repeat surface protein [Spirochaetaceae bacterium]
MAAIDNITNVRIELVVNGEPQETIIADATTTTSVLPKIKPEDTVSGTAYIYVAGESEPRVAQLDETEAALGAVLKFKVPYNYTCFNLSNTQVASGTYFSRDGINLSVQTVSPIGGWHCIEDDTTHMGSIVTGVRGDINLYAVPEEGAPIFTATPDKTTLIGGSTTAGDTTATITVTNATSTPVITTSGSLIYNDPPVQDATDPTKYTVDLHLTGGSSAAMFDDDTSVTVSVMVGTETRTVTFTLKNKYSVEVQYGANAGEMGTFLQGSPVTFATAATAASTMIPAGREAVAFKYGSNIVLYKNASAGATSVNVSSTTFTGLTSRQIILEPLFDFTIDSVTGGDTSVTGQDGTAAHPYILKYGGTASEKQLNFAISNVVVNLNTTTNAGTKLTVQSPASDTPVIKLGTITDADIPAGGKLYTITMTDSGTDATKDIYVKVTKAPVIPDFTVTVTAPTSHVAAKSSGTTYALANVTDTFSFTPYSAEGFPDGTTFTWQLTTTNSSSGDLIDDISRTTSLSTNDGVLTISPSALGLTETVISHSGSSPDGISVSCTANNSAAAVTSKVCTTPGTASAFLLYTIPDFTISITAPTAGISAANSDATNNVYAVKDLSWGYTFTATPTAPATSFPTGTSFSWTIQAAGQTAYTTGASTSTTCSTTLTNLGLTDSNMGTKLADAKTVTISCTASNVNAAADVDATDATMKVFRLTIPAYKITVTPPTGFPSKTSGSNTLYLVNDSNLLDSGKLFTLKAEPVDSSDSFPTGTEFSWKFGSASYTTASTADNPVTKTAGEMCNISTAPTSQTSYTVYCTASLTGASDVSKNIAVVLAPLSITMKNGAEIKTILQNDLGAKSGGAARSFAASTTPPPSGTTTYTLSASGSVGECLAWLDGTAIKYYAAGYTDTSPAVKIPLNANSKEMFSYCRALTSIDVSGFDTSGVTTMEGMFGYCENLTSITGLDGFNTSNVTTMRQMFCCCQALESINVSSFDTSKVTNMYWMFVQCEALTGITGLNSFDTSRVTNMQDMFKTCKSLSSLNVSNFNTSSVTDMGGMFGFCENLTGITGLNNFNTSRVTDMMGMFQSCKVLTNIDVSSFDTSAVEDMQYLFKGCNALTTILASASFVTTSVKVYCDQDMFKDCNNLVGGSGTTYSSSSTNKTRARIDGGPTSATPGYFTSAP